MSPASNAPASSPTPPLSTSTPSPAANAQPILPSPLPVAATAAPSSSPTPHQTPPSPSPSTRPNKRPRPVSDSPTPRPSATPSLPPPPPNAVSRELFLLTGGQTPAPLVPAVSLAPNKPGRPRRRPAWIHAPFTNPARNDGLRLSHWLRAGTPPDYPFRRFARSVRIVTYTTEEYTRIIAPSSLSTTDAAASSRDTRPAKDRPSPPSLRRRTSSPSAPSAGPSRDDMPPPASGGSLRHGIHHVPPQLPWTRAETDELFSLCEQFDLRFPVIHDRWPTTMRPRSIDELKHRYYSVAKLLLDARSQKDPNHLASQPQVLQKHCQAIIMNPFDYEYECIRKNQLQWHYSRSKAELREEEETVREARRIEANRKRIAKERQRLARLLTPAAELASTADARKSSDQPLAAAAAVTQQKTFPHRKVSSGAFARSTMVYAPVSQSQRLCKRIDAALVELDVQLRPTPTTTVVDIFDLLRMEILSFIELQRTVTKKEEDVQGLRVKLAKLKGELVPAPPPGLQMSHKKRRTDDVEIGSLFGPTQSQPRT